MPPTNVTTVKDKKMIADILTSTEKKLATELEEATPSFRLKMACNLVKSDPENWAIVAAANIPGLAEAVRAELAGSEDPENLTPQYDSINIPITTPNMK